MWTESENKSDNEYASLDSVKSEKQDENTEVKVAKQGDEETEKIIEKIEIANAVNKFGRVVYEEIEKIETDIEELKKKLRGTKEWEEKLRMKYWENEEIRKCAQKIEGIIGKEEITGAEKLNEQEQENNHKNIRIKQGTKGSKEDITKNCGITEKKEKTWNEKNKKKYWEMEKMAEILRKIGNRHVRVYKHFSLITFSLYKEL